VDPDTGIRDLQIPRTLIKTYGHGDCGIYGEVIVGGAIAVDDAVGG
jgi:MOSC domain-containing protein YiiM